MTVKNILDATTWPDGPHTWAKADDEKAATAYLLETNWVGARPVRCRPWLDKALPLIAVSNAFHECRSAKDRRRCRPIPAFEREVFTMIRLVSLVVLATAIAAPAMAFDAKGNVGIGTLQSGTIGGAAGGGASIGNGSAHQDAASVGSAGAQLQIKPSGVTVLTQQSSAFSANQSSTKNAGGLSFGGTFNAASGSWAGIGGALKF